MPDRNGNKLEVRLGFADKASRNKVCSSWLVSYHASHYINSAAANDDTIEHLLYWLVPRLQVEYYLHYPSPLFQPCHCLQLAFSFHPSLHSQMTFLIGSLLILVNQPKDSFVHVLE